VILVKEIYLVERMIRGFWRGLLSRPILKLSIGKRIRLPNANLTLVFHTPSGPFLVSRTGDAG